MPKPTTFTSQNLHLSNKHLLENPLLKKEYFAER
jgi:hypothetical protein